VVRMRIADNARPMVGATAPLQIKMSASGPVSRDHLYTSAVNLIIE